jgi:hypothetical protein
MDRCVVEREFAPVRCVEVRPALILTVIVDIEVVPDHMDRLCLLVLRRHLFHECHQIACRPRRTAGGDHIPRRHVQRRQH